MLRLSQPNGSGGCECPCKCHDLFGDTLEAVIGGITECLTCFSSGGAGFGFIAQFAGINSGHSVPYVGGNVWSKDIGIVTVTTWNNGDDSCTGDPVDTSTASANISISCNPATNSFLVGVNVPAFGSLSGPLTLFSGGGMLDTIMANSFTNPDCGTGFPVVVIGYDGAIVLTNP